MCGRMRGLAAWFTPVWSMTSEKFSQVCIFNLKFIEQEKNKIRGEKSWEIGGHGGRGGQNKAGEFEFYCFLSIGVNIQLPALFRRCL